MPANKTAPAQLVAAAFDLRTALGKLAFGPPVTHVYNPLVYAWPPHEAYLKEFGRAPKRVVFLGMNPGPFGMVQTGVPFGEIRAVRDWMQITQPVDQPPSLHPKRPVLGFDCPRSEVSGQRLWGLCAQHFGTARAFFARHFVVNYCPLAFFAADGCNVTPNKLKSAEAAPLLAACDHHLRSVLRILHPEWLIAIGRFAEERARFVASDLPIQLACIPHPSPANPAANRGWEATVAQQLRDLGVWD
jgi:single-strand selective monofunctional uracil DNA glycosylase